MAVKQNVNDSYKEFIDYFGIKKDDLFDYGIQSIICADFDTAKTQYDELKVKLTSNQSLTIRSYGRNGNNSLLYRKMYIEIFGNSSIKIDSTNNAVPRANISKATGHTINGDIFNYQVSHVWGKTKNPILFEAVWNICFVPRIIDPFTGHECKGGWNEEFIPKFKEHVYSSFEDVIEDYNQFIRNNNVQNKIREYVKKLRKGGNDDAKLIDRFEEDALGEWQLISR